MSIWFETSYSQLFCDRIIEWFHFDDLIMQSFQPLRHFYLIEIYLLFFLTNQLEEIIEVLQMKLLIDIVMKLHNSLIILGNFDVFLMLLSV